MFCWVFFTLCWYWFREALSVKHRWYCSICTYTIPFPHLSQTGSFCRFPVGGVCLTVGAFTVLVTIGWVPVHMEERPPTKQLCTCSWLEHINKNKTLKRHEVGACKAKYHLLMGHPYWLTFLIIHFKGKHMERYYSILYIHYMYILYIHNI